MIAGLAATLPAALDGGLRGQGVPAGAAHDVAALPPVSSLFATVLGVNPVEHLLSAGGGLAAVPPANRATLTGREFFPELLAGPFHHGLVIVFAVAAGLGVLAGLASVLRGAAPARPARPIRPAGGSVDVAQMAAVGGELTDVGGGSVEAAVQRDDLA